MFCSGDTEEGAIEFGVRIARTTRPGEQKNGSDSPVVIAGQALAHLYGAMRLYHFQPSSSYWIRAGTTVRKRYEKPATPCDRLLRRADVSEEAKQRLRSSRV